MHPVQRLRRDHGILRAKLDVVESALRMGPEAWYVLWEVCFTLSRQIRDHLRREEALIAACRKGLSRETLAHIRLEHKDEPRHLREINRMFIADQAHTLEAIRPRLTELIQGMRAHLAEEEATLFPSLERVLGELELTEPAGTPVAGRLGEDMTVNQVVQGYPVTRRVFEQLFVNIPYEGCTCLDEVAWRHGMTTGELVERLEHAVRPRGKAPEHSQDAGRTVEAGCGP